MEPEIEKFRYLQGYMGTESRYSFTCVHPSFRYLQGYMGTGNSGEALTLSHFNKEKVNGRKNGKREDV